MPNDKPLGLWSATCLVVASMIGAGVFTTSGFTLLALQSREWVMAAWAAGGVVALLGAISYGALARHIAESGGEYLFLSRAVHPAAGFVAGWVSLLAGFTGAIAFAAKTLEKYLFVESPSGLPDGTIAVTAVALCGLLHALHVGRGAIAQNVIVGLKLTLLAAFILIAFGLHLSSGWPGLEDPVAPVGPVEFSFALFASQLVWISFSYSGYNAAVYVSGEVRQAERNVPLAMALATVVVAVLYVLLNAVFIYGPRLEVLVGGDPVQDIAAVAANSLGGRGLALAVRGVIVIGLMTSVSANIQAGPRVYAKMAEDRLFPSLFDSRQGPPRAAILLQSALAILVILISDLEGLLEYLGFTLSLSTAATVASLFILRRRHSQLQKPTTSPWLLVIAVAYVIAVVGLALIAVSGDPHQITGTVVTVVSGLLVYWLLRRRAALPRRI